MILNTIFLSKENFPMKNKFTKLLMAATIILLLLAATMPVLAGGDKVRGDLAQGSANQVQVQDPPPFQP